MLMLSCCCYVVKHWGTDEMSDSKGPQPFDNAASVWLTNGIIKVTAHDGELTASADTFSCWQLLDTDE